jgi:hypothetical protein
MKNCSGDDVQDCGGTSTGTSLGGSKGRFSEVARQRIANVSGRDRSMTGSDGDLMKFGDHVADGKSPSTVVCW